MEPANTVRSLSDLVGLLSTRSDEFRVPWASHDVRFHRSGTKRLRHPLVGDLKPGASHRDIHLVIP